jgi:hypothetical protein
MSKKRLNLVGEKFGRLKVLEYAGNNKHRSSLWLCKCDCGNEKIIKGRNLINGDTKSCGCLHKEINIKNGQNNKGNKRPDLSERNKVNKDKKLSKEHRDKVIKTLNHDFGKNNPGYIHGLSKTREYKNAWNAKRKAKKRAQTPINADPIKIQKIYSFCAKLNETGFFRYEVDHIKPLSKGGLHHQNYEKSNKWPLTETEKIKYRGVTLKDLKNYEQ